VSGPGLGASVRQRLLAQSRAQGRPFQELLQYFAMERFLYRLATSPFADRFVLKGALLLTAWRAPLSRPTMDIDLAGQTGNRLAHIRAVVRANLRAYLTPGESPANVDLMEEITFQVFNDEDSGRLVASWDAPDRSGGITTQGHDLQDLQQQVSEAVEAHFDEGQAPRRIRLHFVNDPVLIQA